MTRGELQQQVLKALSFEKPTQEWALRMLFAKQGVAGEDVKRALDTLHSRNEIRWVAFSGWCRGGRPE